MFSQVFRVIHCQVAQVSLLIAAISTRVPQHRWETPVQGKHTFPISLPEKQRGRKTKHNTKEKKESKKTSSNVGYG